MIKLCGKKESRARALIDSVFAVFFLYRIVGAETQVG